MSLPPDIQRLLTRLARILALFSWGGFVYALFHRPRQISSLPEIGFLTVATLLCSLLAFLCSLTTLDEDFASLSGWMFVIFCSVPFLGMLWLLNPAGIGPP